MRYEDLESLMSENGITKQGYKFFISKSLYFTDERDGDVALCSTTNDEAVCEYRVEDLEEWCPTFKAWNECPTCNGHGRYYSVWSNDPKEEGMEADCECCEKPINK